MRICCITPHQLVNNPRVVREARALAAAGHDVRVIAVSRRADQNAFDASLAAGERWRLELVNVERGSAPGSWLLTGGRQKAAKAVWSAVRRGEWLATLAYCRTASETLRLVTREPADLIVAHTQQMLGVAWAAASRLRCAWGFDCEDILSEELGEGLDDPSHQALVRYVEQTFIPRADYVTVASPEFSKWLRDHIAVNGAVYVANAPSIDDAPERLQPGFPTERPFLSLYWLSISLGPQRGVEDAIRALPHVTVPVQLHLRGRVLPGYARELRDVIAAAGVADRVTIHDLTPPRDAVRSAAAHDIGLVLTQPCCQNHEMAVPNKIYTYLMGGLAVGATSTAGHRSVLEHWPGVSFQYPAGDYLALAGRINALASEPARLHAARAEAFRVARAHANWETEQRSLLGVVAGVEARTASAARLAAGEAASA